MNRLHLSLASLMTLLLAGCVSYGPHYGQQRAVYRDGGYYVAGDSQYGDYYYGAPEVEYRYVDTWSSHGFWRMDRYGCGFYGDCWRYRGYRHWDPFASHWGGWSGPPQGWSIVIAPSWYYGHWGWHGHRHGHDWREHPRRPRTQPYDTAPSRPIAPRDSEPAPAMPPRRPLPSRHDDEFRREPRSPDAERLPRLRERSPSYPPSRPSPRTTEPAPTMPPRRPLPSGYDGEYRREPGREEAERLPRLREQSPRYPASRPLPRPLMPEAGYERPRQPERADAPVQPRARADAELPRQWQRPSPQPAQPRMAPPPSQPMPRHEAEGERSERLPRSRDEIEP